MLEMVPSMVWGGDKTNTTGALKLMRESIFSLSGGDRSNISNLCILITDGKTDTDVGTIDAAAASAATLLMLKLCHDALYQV